MSGPAYRAVLGLFRGGATYSYGSDTRLDTVTLPDGTQITYYYGAALGPVEKHINGVLAESYIWHNATRLGAWIDHVRGARAMFRYADGRCPVAVTIEGPNGAATYQLGFDQIGTIKQIVAADGKLIKEMTYDSFGNMNADSNPELFLPLGFASGLVDRHTGLIRFGYRDYDPAMGRFTVLDPARDMRGDGDVWDYCVDDPINCVDPMGLESEPAKDDGGNKGNLPATGDQESKKSATGKAVMTDAQSYPVTGVQVYSGNRTFEVYSNGERKAVYPYTSGVRGVTDPKIKGAGPTPPGQYTIDPKEASEVDGLRYAARNIWGDWGHGRVPLHPLTGTDTYGRDGFFIHGGNKPGSIGCVDIGRSDKEFFGNLKRSEGTVPVTIH